MVGIVKKILDACCGSRMFWFDREHENVLFMDNRELEDILCDGRKLEIKPDIIGDFRKMVFPDESFQLVVFDPPHLIRAGEKSWIAKKYGKLNPETWQEDFRKGFSECFRVLKNDGILIFKWNEDQIKLGEILKLSEYKPLFGNRRSKTHWIVFMKIKKKDEDMKRKIRNGTFETNSSSMHSLVIENEEKLEKIRHRDKSNIKIDDERYITIETQDYTTENYVLKTQQEKLNYIASCKINEDGLYLWNGDLENNSKHSVRTAMAGNSFITLEEYVLAYTGAKGINLNLLKGCNTENILEYAQEGIKISDGKEKVEEYREKIFEEKISILDIIFNNDIHIIIKER